MEGFFIFIEKWRNQRLFDYNSQIQNIIGINTSKKYLVYLLENHCKA